MQVAHYIILSLGFAVAAGPFVSCVASRAWCLGLIVPVQAMDIQDGTVGSNSSGSYVGYFLGRGVHKNLGRQFSG